MGRESSMWGVNLKGVAVGGKRGAIAATRGQEVQTGPVIASGDRVADRSSVVSQRYAEPDGPDQRE
ncbi:MAG TPA: hypothetical protein DEG13_14940 [Candidatus Microthrix parvicella]|nr:hypothetical protein [Candidatus Microthrix parvicella]